MSILSRTIIFLFLVFPLLANDEINYLVKTMSWKKIRRSINASSIRNESEAYALARYHEESGEGDPSTRLRLYYGIITGSYPDEVGKEEVDKLLKLPSRDQTVIARLSYFKLYYALTGKKLLNKEEKVQYLQKFTIERDPIVIRAFEEILKIHLDAKEYDNIIKRITALTDDEKNYLITPSVVLIQAQSLVRVGKIQEGKNLYFSILSKSYPNSQVKRNAFSDLKTLFGNNFYNESTREELALLLPYLGKSDLKDIYSRKIFSEKDTAQNSRAAKNLARFFLKVNPDQILVFVKNNSALISGEKDFLLEFANELMDSREFRIAEDILTIYFKNPTIADAHKAYARLYKKQDKEEKYFHSLINYLELMPYDLKYHDALIDFLTNHKDNTIVYAPEEYWAKALGAIPNLPVKGRLVYWYLRFLKYKGDSDKLKAILPNYYSLCPGSYYTVVIFEEFEKEIGTISVPDSPLSSRENLFKYLSLKGHNDAYNYLQGQNLSFAYYKDSYELGIRLVNASQKAEGHRLLQLAVGYLKFGEYGFGVELVDAYVEKNGLGENDRSELLVGVGDLSRNTYLSLFFTRTLMKQYKIPDDPFLLPTTITTRLYPRPHRDIVVSSSREFSVEEEIIYAIMRQESFFKESAISSANARGLMQVMPSTGKFLAKKLSVGSYSLHDPEVSIRFGAKFLSDLLKSYDNKLKWAAIAYNGGPGNLRKWKRNHYYNDFNHFLEELPNKESRDYCRIIVSNYINYKILRKMEGLASK